MKFRKKPVEVEAVQLTWNNWNEVCDLLEGIINKNNGGRTSENYSDTVGEFPPYIEITIPRLEGNLIVKHGDWIIKEPQVGFYSRTPDIFEQIFEPVEEDMQTLVQTEILYTENRKEESE